MKCPICNEETAGSEAKMWGCEFAHVACIKAYSLGASDAALTNAGRAVAWQFRWLNPGDNIEACPEELEWKPLVPRSRNQTQEQAIAELEAHSYGGRPVYEVRALGVIGATPPSAVEAAQPEAVGWKRVPIEPTEAMLKAGVDAFQHSYSEADILSDWRACFRAMLAAAPTTEATSSSDAERAIAGALFDFLGFLTTSERQWTFSSYDEASPAVEALEQWAKKRNLSLDEADVSGWSAAIDAAIANKGGKL